MNLPGLRNVNLKKFIVAYIAVFIYVMVTDYVIHQLLMKGYYEATPTLWRAAEEMGSFAIWMVLAQLIYAKIFTLLFVKGYEGTGAMEGVRFGFYMWGIAVSGFLLQYAVSPIPCNILCGWTGYGLVQLIGAGVVAAVVYKKK